MSKHGLHKSSNFIEVLDTRQAFYALTYIHDLGSNEGQSFRDRLRGQSSREHHGMPGEPGPGFSGYREVERQTSTTSHVRDLRLHQYGVGFVGRFYQQVQV